ncbi:uncharacterized protein V1510DRAFT_365408 [Dipodascopsis tothii]|uniref:uncharacterized protein n=1 Tax=Dipodascopsis tothii TaxID=44089 RepID=UPI0034CFE359
MGNSSSAPAPTGTRQEQAQTKLTQLIRANHATYAVLYHDRRFHNHLPHLLGSAYLLGASAGQLAELYEAKTSDLEQWREDNPDEVTADDWVDLCGRREYQRGFRDYFDEEMMEYNYDWRRVVAKYLLAEDGRLLNALAADVAHPLIHLAYAVELDSAELAVEALTLAAVCYSPYTSLVGDFVAAAPTGTERDPLAVLSTLRTVPELGFTATLNVDAATDTYARVLDDDVLPHIERALHALDTVDASDALERITRACATLLTATHPDDRVVFDFYLLHALTAAHAAQVVLPLFAGHERALVGALWLHVILLYVAVQRPSVRPERDSRYVMPAGESWETVTELALSGPQRQDVHYVKALRALRWMDGIYSPQEHEFLRPASKFAREKVEFAFGAAKADRGVQLDAAP